MSKKITCTKCHGWGTIKDKWMPCGICHGKSRGCKTCKGKGKLRVTCRLCHGAGWFKKKEEKTSLYGRRR